MVTTRGRSASDVERFLAASAGTLRRLAWLLSGEAGSATELLRQTLAAAYVRGRGGTDAERATEARRWMVGTYLRGADDVRAARPVVAVRLRPREWAAAALVHGLGRRRVAAAVLAGSLAVAAAGVLLPQLNRVDGQAIRIEPDGWYGRPAVEARDGSGQELEAHAIGGRLTMTLHDPSTGPVTDSTPLPTSPHELGQGEIAGMPYYVVRGEAVESWVFYGPAVPEGSDRSAQVIHVGGWSVLWPRQSLLLAAAAREPLGLLWHTADGAHRGSTARGRYSHAERTTVRTSVGDVLVVADGTRLLLMSWAGESHLRIRGGRALVAHGSRDTVLPYAAVGYGPITHARGPSRVVGRVQVTGRRPCAPSRC